MKYDFLKKSISKYVSWKYFLLTILCVFLSSGTYAQREKNVDSKIKHVTIFLDKAQVTREVITKVDAGKTNLILSRLSSQLDQQSIQVKGKGNFTILGIAHHQNFLDEINRPRKLQILIDSLDNYNKQLVIECPSLKKVDHKG